LITAVRGEHEVYRGHVVVLEGGERKDEEEGEGGRE
jgi:hypothetical protein